MGTPIKNKKKRQFMAGAKRPDQISNPKADPVHSSSKKKRKRERKDIDPNSAKKKRVAFDAQKDEILVTNFDHNLNSKDAANSGNGASGQPNESHFSNTRFDQCSISPLSLKGIQAAGYEKMTVVQEATLPVILKGKDVLAKAKTGTGKTASFLLPAIEVVSKLPPVDSDKKGSPIYVLVICPTRELANQVATVATTLTNYHRSIGVQIITGGTKMTAEQKRMHSSPCQILVATPGRLTDHIKNTSGFSAQLLHLKVLVLDEADRLLDMGFRKDIEKIIAAVPIKRQTLLFSATVSSEVRQICMIAMKSDHEYISTVEEGAEETHAQVSQMHLIAPLGEHFPILYSILSEHISEDIDYKLGVAASREQYIHRLGRTGRKGKEGKGILMLAPQEKYFLSKIKDLPLLVAPFPPADPNIRKKVDRALSNVDMVTKESAYQAWLGYYNGDKVVGKNKHDLVNLANEFSRSMGLEVPPAIP